MKPHFVQLGPSQKTTRHPAVCLLPALVLVSIGSAAHATTVFPTPATAAYGTYGEVFSGNGAAAGADCGGNLVLTASCSIVVGNSVSSSADLTTNTLSLEGSDTGPNGIVAHAYFWDTITFFGAAPGEQGRFDFILNDSLSGDGFISGGLALSSRPLPGVLSTVAVAQCQSNSTNGCWGPTVDLGFNFNIVNGLQYVIMPSLDASARIGSFADPPNFELILPPDVTYISADGFSFAGAPQTPNPEPGSLLLLSIGGLGFAGWRYRRNRRALS